MSKCWKIVEFPKISIKMKNCKTFYKAQTASRLKGIIQPTFLEETFSYRDIQKYTDICFQSASRMQFLGVRKWCSANFFSDTKEKNFCWKICKVRKVFGCALLAYYFRYQVSWVEVRKMSKIFRVKLYYKMSDLFR